jgi:hypothetical protein
MKALHYHKEFYILWRHEPKMWLSWSWFIAHLGLHPLKKAMLEETVKKIVGKSSRSKTAHSARRRYIMSYTLVFRYFILVCILQNRNCFFYANVEFFFLVKQMGFLFKNTIMNLCLSLYSLILLGTSIDLIWINLLFYEYGHNIGI